MEIRIYDYIGQGGITAEGVAQAIPEGTTEIEVRINTPGGSVADGLAIYNYLRDHEAHVTTIVDGFAASAGSLIMLAGDVRLVHEGSVVMVHDPWTMAVGNSRELRKTADDIDEIWQAATAIYEARTGLSKDELRALFEGETYMRGSVALEYGFASGLIEESTDQKAIAACAPWLELMNTLTGGKEIMSKQQTRKEVEAERDELEVTKDMLQAQITEITGSLDAMNEAHAAELNQIAEARNAEAEARNAEVADLQSRNAELEATTIEMGAAVAALNDRCETLQTGLDAISESVKSNPAFAIAAVEAASGEDVRGQLDAEADAAEAEARNNQPAEPKDELEAYEAMEAGEPRQKFWAENKRKIMKLIEERNAQ